MKLSQVALVFNLAVAAVTEAATITTTVTPVEKVIQLLGDLSKQIEEEGKAEATAYDKYACFCKAEVDDKLYAIETSTAKIATLDAKIEELGAEITTLDGEISALSKEIGELDSDMKSSTETRQTEHSAFVVEQEDVDGAISACERAIAALTESKKAMSGKSELEADALVQVKAVSALAIGSSLVSGKVSKDLLNLQQALSTIQPGEAYQYTYKSNHIIEILQTLLAKFKASKGELEQDEFNTNSAFEKRLLGLTNDRKFADKDRSEKQALSSKKQEEKAATEADRAQELKEKTADESFLEVLKGDCETKASLWDQRSKTRSEELKAIADAQTALKDGVAPNWQSNKKLVDLQEAKKVPVKGHWVYIEEPSTPQASKAPAFVQIARSTGSLRGGSPGKRIAQLLMKSATSLKSAVLSAAAMKVTVSEDHFVKVRQIIKDLVEKLEGEAAAEKTQKMFCDEEMSKAVELRDKEHSAIEVFEAEISGNEAKKAQLKGEIATLSKEIAANKKALLEASELRQEEKQENTKTVTEADAGKEAVEQALQVLKEFYEGAAFIQKGSFIPTNSDREGKTVADKAPEVFDAEYKGSQEASKGILGLLEIILSDFERTVSTVTEQEADAAEAFATFKTDIEADTKTKEAAVKLKEDEITSIEEALLTLKDDLSTSTESLEMATGELDKLKTMCVEGEETYEERVAKRKAEIEALKQAHDILENWQQ